MIQLTTEQQAVVDNCGGTLLVSAAAGSGKTKVLVDRLFRYVLEEGCHVDDFLIITYTRAAAAELRNKIATELSRRMGADPSNSHLRAQVLRVYRADIKTVDAFCTALLRENTHLLAKDEQTHSLSPDFRVLDEGEALLLRQRVLEKTLHEFYHDMTDGQRQLADTLGAGRDDSRLSELVLELHGKLQSNPHPAQWLQTQRYSWENLADHFSDTAYGLLLHQTACAQLSHWKTALETGLETWCDSEMEEKYPPVFEVAIAGLNAASESLDWTHLQLLALNITFPRLPSIRGRANDPEIVALKKLWAGAKAQVKKLLELLTVSPDEAMEDLQEVAPAMVALVDLTQDFSTAYAMEKRRRNCADFSDQEHFALELLIDPNGNPTELGSQLSGRYREIMVDEYQDTNLVQNAIFSAVSRQEQNLFFVGDVKQSIYRFRLADPTIFLTKYAQFSNYTTAHNGQPRKIMLSKNFRSRQSVLDGANFICAQLFSKDVGGLEYDDDQALHFGASYYPERQDTQMEYHLLWAPQGGKKNPTALKKPVVEAQFVAHRIRTLLDEQYPVATKDGGFRPCRPEDFVILMRSPSSRSAIFAQALAEEGVACSFEESVDYFHTMEIAVAMAILQVIDNPRQDVPLIALMRSPVFAFTPDRLAQLRAHCPKGMFYEALLADGGDDVLGFLEQIQLLRHLSRDCNVQSLLWQVYNQWNLLGIFGAMDGGDARRENLIALTRHAQQFETNGYRGVFGFVRQLQQLMAQGKAPQTATMATSGVGLMSIHKSKGLEFPIVIVCDLDKAFSRQDLNPYVLVHPQLGLGPKRVDLQRKIQYSTLARTALEQQIYQENLDEELRVLYVALTRPQEKLILVHTLYSAHKRLEKLAVQAACPVAPEALRSASCLGDWILLALLCRPEAKPLLDLAGMTVPELYTGDTESWHVFPHVNWERPAQEEASPDVEAAQDQTRLSPLLDFQYPYSLETTLPAKITATALKGRSKDEQIADHAMTTPYLRPLTQPKFAQETQGLTPAQVGTANHLALQYLDFGCTDVEQAVAEMSQKALLTPEQANAVGVKQFQILLDSPLGEALRQAKTLYREFPFAVLIDATTFDPNATAGEQMMLQGVVDCCYETDAGLVIVDFKTDRVFGDTLTQRANHYAPQVAAYALALERVLEKPVVQKVLYFLQAGQAIEV
ncbi:helicase-exonuclease AddAB subunit AddA [Bengtsoniella intestinalis]|uniref:helicase-exonuclease AddAB subunit AddA n=1 Tax=Bengtsoniella intestinalis TaxID=3073143 RepID=UPI00391EEC16